jgi:hypothetical protein
MKNPDKLALQATALLQGALIQAVALKRTESFDKATEWLVTQLATL